MRDFFHGLSTPMMFELLAPLLWLTVGTSLAMTTYTLYKVMKQRRLYFTHQRVSAMSQARFAVFDSFIRAGGRTTPLEESIEMQFRNDYASRAEKQGADYYELFHEYETRADQELLAVIMKLGGTVTHEHE